jgi:putative DNA primase/helicase
MVVVNELIRRGKTDDEIVAVLLDRANRISEHVYAQKQGAEQYARKQIAKALAKARATATAAAKGDGGLKDTIALAFSEKHADALRYVSEWNRWFQWDGVRWVHEKTLYAFHLARDLCRDVGDAKHKTVAAVVGLARTDRRQAAVVEQWDKDPWLLGTAKGTVDLRTGELREPRQSDYITRIVRTVPSSDPPRDSCPLWLTFLNQVLPDREIQDYMQRVCGYCLTGSTKEHALSFLYGVGGNGKVCS